jgi:indolepyruvate ferredoxin oxidoreductase beta subunit
MKKDIILAGVGGQGVLSVSAIIGLAIVRSGLFLKQAEVHGMSQRGGEVHSNLRLSDHEIASDIIPAGQVDLILSIEPMEGLRYLPMLSPGGWLVTNTNPHINIPNYPDLDTIIAEINKVPNHLTIDAEKLAREIGSAKVANTIVLGAASPFLGIPFENMEAVITDFFSVKGAEIVKMNIRALRIGRDYSLENIR